MRLTRLSLQTMELERSKPATARPDHITRLLSKAKNPDSDHTRGNSFTPHLTYAQLRWSTPESTLTSSNTLKRTIRPIPYAFARPRDKLRKTQLKPRARKSGFGGFLSVQPRPVHISWDKFKPVTSVKPATSESRLLRKLLLSGLLLTH